MFVKKRDGRKQKFNQDKIINAVQAAFIKVDGELTKQATDKSKEIAKYIESLNKIMEVEEIQDIVESKLMASSRKDVAKEYVLYRAERTRERNKRSEFNKRIGEKLTASNVQNSNANMDEYSFGGRVGEAASELTKDYALDNLISEKARYNHENNIVYIHDLNSYACGMHNCLSIPFDDLLKNGFDTRQQSIRPAGSISSAFQLIAVIMQCQSLVQFGGVAATHIDWSLVPYVRKSLFKHYVLEAIKDSDEFDNLNVINSSIEDIDNWIKEHKNKYLNKFHLKEEDFFIGSDKLDRKLYKKALFETIKEADQAVEGMFHNLNSLQSRSGNQLPFSSICYGTCTLEEGRLITKAILENSIKGGGKLHSTYIFPCQIFKIAKGINKEPNTPNYDLYRLALKSTTLRLYPNYANVDWSVNSNADKNNIDEEMATMGCRTYNGFDMNGFGQMKDGRGNIAPNTIILPKLAMMAKGEIGNKDIDDFMKILDKTIFEAKDQLIERYNWICSQDARSGAFMYENGTMRGYVPEEGIRSALKHGTLAIGQIGLAETLQILIGCDHTEEKGMKLAKRIEQLFKDRCNEFKHELHKDEDGYEYYLNFGVYYTPAEGLCYTALNKFRKEFGVIPNVSDKEFFTNSVHVPVWKKMNAFEKIDIESQLDGYSSAGCILYIEADSSIRNNLDALEAVVNYAMDKDVPYFAINVPNDQCNDCGYTGLIKVGDNCPVCGSDNVKRLRRVTGYLTGNYLTAFNKGKVDEVEHRVVHLVGDYMIN